MEYAWIVPEEGTAKINIHSMITEEPRQNGNTISTGVIIRDSNGAKLWGAMGPMEGFTEDQALMWGVQVGCIHAHLLGFKSMHIEITNGEVFEDIRLQEVVIIPAELREAFIQFNTLYANHFDMEDSVRRVTFIPLERNRTAEYMAVYGLENMPSFVEAPGIFGNLKYFLDRDMGLALPYPAVELLSNFGEGEVIDASPPVSPARSFSQGLTQENMEVDDFSMASMMEDEIETSEDLGIGMEGIMRVDNIFSPFTVTFPHIPEYSVLANLNVNINLNVEVTGGPSQMIDRNHNAVMLEKGKGKVLAGFSFNNEGLLSKEAIEIIDKGILIPISTVFDSEIIDLDAEIFEGVMAKDLLESAVNGTLDTLLGSVKLNKHKSAAIKILNGGSIQNDPFPQRKQTTQAMEIETLDVEKALLEMAAFEERVMAVQGGVTDGVL